MSAEIAYKLLVDMGVRGSLGPQMDRAGAKAKGIDDHFKKIGTSFGSAIGSAAAGIERLGDAAIGAVASAGRWAAAGAAAGAAYGVHLNSELEKSKLSLGAIFTAQGITDGMGNGLKMASATIKEMRKDAAMLPGEFSDLLSFFKLGATPAFNIGASTKDLEKLSANAMAAAAATGVQMDQAAREFAQLLQGRAGAHNVFGSMLGLRAENFNHLSGGERLKAIQEALGKYQGSIAEYGKSFDALSSTMRDNAKETLRRATAPIFTRIKEQLSTANTWFDSNQEKVGRFADRVGESLQHGFDVGRQKIAEWWPAIQTFAANARAEFEKIWATVGPLLAKLESFAKQGLADPKLFSRIEGAGRLYAGAKLGTMAAPAFSGASGLLGELGVAAGPAAIGLAAVAVSAEGAFNVLTDSSNEWHNTATKLAKETAGHMGGAADQWAKIGVSAQKVADIMGVGLLYGIEQVSATLESLGWAANQASTGLKFLYDKLDLSKHFMTSAEPPSGERAPKMLGQILAGREDEESRRYHAESTTKKGAGGGGGGTHIQKVEIVVTSNQDPSRIARMTADRLQDISRFPTSSSRARNWGAERP